MCTWVHEEEEDGQLWLPSGRTVQFWREVAAPAGAAAATAAGGVVGLVQARKALPAAKVAAKLAVPIRASVTAFDRFIVRSRDTSARRRHPVRPAAAFPSGP